MTAAIDTRILGDRDDHGPGCGHEVRYRTQAGSVLCELCERLRTGWDFCPLCGRFEPLVFSGYGDEDGDWNCCARCAEDESPW